MAFISYRGGRPLLQGALHLMQQVKLLISAKNKKIILFISIVYKFALLLYNNSVCF